MSAMDRVCVVVHMIYYGGVNGLDFALCLDLDAGVYTIARLISERTGVAPCAHNIFDEPPTRMIRCRSNDQIRTLGLIEGQTLSVCVGGSNRRSVRVTAVIRSGDRTLTMPLVLEGDVTALYVKRAIEFRTGIPVADQLITYRSCDSIEELGAHRRFYAFDMADSVIMSVLRIDDFAQSSTMRATAHRDDVCCVCLDNVAIMRYMPCGHRCVCAFCEEQMARTAPTCPLCRAPIARRLHEFAH